ncbi:feruloyl-CoA synthase [Rhodanobacter aciditrophus]|uniref:Feruloyl-CoA synthase n=1 Tax=Rhodanobacter aciditrophus TaxID=1623218 RepID=A0ABW4AW59_9GAMM
MTSEFHPVKVVSHPVSVEKRSNGEQIVHSQTPLVEYARCLTDRVAYWAEKTPDTVCIAQRDSSGAWEEYTYSETLTKVRELASWLLTQNVSPERPIAFLCGNSVQHLLLALAGSYIGVPHAPISPAYSLIATDYSKLKHVIDSLTPGLVIVDKLAPYEKAIAATCERDVTVAVMDDGVKANLISNPIIGFSKFWKMPINAEIEKRNAEVNGDTVAKILFTSGTTGMPKGVMNTQRMLCANAVMIRETMAFLKDETPVMVDWLPWNHTFGGNHNVSIALYNGGSLYLDDGKPTETHFHKTLTNLAEVAPTVYFNVPKGFELLVKKLQQDDVLAQQFFSRLRLMFFAAAGMAQHIWDAIDELSIKHTGKKIPIVTGLGCTETAPSVTFASIEESASGVIGTPAPGISIKLVPNEGKLEARVKAVSVMPGYWRQPELSQKAFDEEGFYCLGDAFAFLDENTPNRGFRFDGRVSEDFKLDSGTWVSAGTLRSKFISAFAPLAQDIVLCGSNRSDITGLVFPDVNHCQALIENGVDLSVEELVNHPTVRAAFEEKLKAFAAQGTGSSTVVQRILLQHVAPSIDAHEVTDKGSLNLRNVQSHRADQVEMLYQMPKSVSVISV